MNQFILMSLESALPQIETVPFMSWLVLFLVIVSQLKYPKGYMFY